MQLKSKKGIVLWAGLVLVCFSMRSPMSPVGPLVFQIKASLGLSAGFAGLLTTIPLLIFGAVSPFAGRLLNRAGDKTLIPACLGLSFTGIFLRSYAGISGLLLGTGLIGLGIGILNVTIPVFLRANFPERIGVAMGVYTMSMTLLSALSAGFCVPLSDAIGGWGNALAAFAVLPVLAIPAWLLAARQGFAKREQTQSMSLREVAKSRVNRCIALFMALQSALFFCMIAWLPSTLLECGAAKEDMGLLMLLMQLVSLSTNFLMPILLQRFPKKRGRLALLCGVIYAVGFSLLLRAPLPAWGRVLSVILLGLASGLSLSFALTMITIRGRDRRETAGISAFSQCVGYLLAAPAPALLGSLYDAAGSFFLPVLALILLCVPTALFGIWATGGEKETGRTA
ncbi:MAG: MFS transporter [Eubacteriales bacterium]|nr:MFS transporter [Eubacteriales bacterium]